MILLNVMPFAQMAMHTTRIKSKVSVTVFIFLQNALSRHNLKVQSAEDDDEDWHSKKRFSPGEFSFVRGKKEDSRAIMGARGRRLQPGQFFGSRGRRVPPANMFSFARGRRGVDVPLDFLIPRVQRTPPSGFIGSRGKKAAPSGFSFMRGKKEALDLLGADDVASFGNTDGDGLNRELRDGVRYLNDLMQQRKRSAFGGSGKRMNGKMKFKDE